MCHQFRIINSMHLSPMPDGQPQGHQHDSGPYYCAVIDGPHGRIPGKAGLDGVAHYPWGGQEHSQHGGFMYVLGH